MEHVVFFTDPLGASSFRRFTSRDDALRYIEHLRNDEGVEDVSLYAMSPIPVNFRAYVRAEVVDDTVPYARDPESAEADRAPADVGFFTN